MGRKKNNRRDNQTDEYGYGGPYQQPHDQYTGPGPYYDNGAYLGYGPGARATGSHMDDRRGFMFSPFQSIPHPWRDQKYPGPNYYEDGSEMTLKDSEASSRDQRRKMIVVAVIVVVILIVGAVIGSILAATLGKDSSNDQPRTQQIAVVRDVFGEATLDGKTFTEELNNPESQEYKQLEEEFIQNMDAAFQNSDMSDKYNGTIVDRFKSGSVITEYRILMWLTVTVMSTNIDNADIGRENAAVTEDLSALAVSAQEIVRNTNGIANAQMASTDHCDSSPCLNGAICTSGVNSYTCSCVLGYAGENCQTDINNCDPDPCQNGQCHDGIGFYTCDCTIGFQGDNCETNIDDCLNAECVNVVRCDDGVATYDCVCQTGWTGILCDTNINECDSSPCQNGGECRDEIGGYECACLDGFDGDICQNNIDDCNPNPCQNGGLCTDGTAEYTCDCLDGFDDNMCQNNIDECNPNPCQNGGSCTDGTAEYTCACLNGFDGNMCQNNIDECNPNPCQNGGSCTDGTAEYTCACLNGFDGNMCQNNIDECNPNPCQNGGSCTDGIADYTCACLNGFDGNMCQNNIDECNPNPCQNGGLCTDGTAEYTCACLNGFDGNMCQNNIDECNPNPCQNGGSCTDGTAEYTCACLNGFDGNMCQNNIDECNPNPCQNGGSCTDGTAEYTCACLNGFDGNICQNNIDECNPNPCQNGGSCTDGTAEYTCACLNGFDGNMCQNNIDECNPNPCQNGGSCTDGTAEYTCACLNGFDGNMCQNNIDECNPNPCQNGGSCTDGTAEYTCDCLNGFDGHMCQNNIDECNPNPYQNGGSCTDGTAEYTCACLNDFDGIMCQNNIDECNPNPCQNGGSCTDGTAEYTCACLDGFFDDNCQSSSETSPNPTAATSSPTSSSSTTSTTSSLSTMTSPSSSPTTISPSLSSSTTTAATSPSESTTMPSTRTPTTITTTTSTSTTTWPGSNCDGDEFECNDGRCINASYVCNNYPDCFNAEDESSEICGSETSPNPTAATSSPTSSSSTTSTTSSLSTMTSPSLSPTTISPSLSSSTTTAATSPSESTTMRSTRTPTTITTITSTSTTTWPGSNCDGDEFECNDGRCIIPSYVCNNYADCFNAEDESSEICGSETSPNPTAATSSPTSSSSTTITTTTLTSTTTWPGSNCDGDEFECNDGRCINASYVCNNYPDCFNAEDESSEICDCDGDEFECNDGRCINASYVCNDYADCFNAEDESSEICDCNGDAFECNDGRCIIPSYVCDSYPDCFNAEDESSEICDCDGSRCANRVGCYTELEYCDGVSQCTDGSDEINCPLRCGEDEFKCRDVYKCVNRTVMCDGTDDCGDNSDEYIGCPEIPQPNPVPSEVELRLGSTEEEESRKKRDTLDYGLLLIRPAGSDEPWGTVCHDMWDDRDAAVVCRKLGYGDSPAYGYKNAVFGEGEGEIYMSNVRCNGDEASLIDCEFKWKQVHCTHAYDASVSCGGSRMFPETTTASTTTLSTSPPVMTTLSTSPPVTNTLSTSPPVTNTLSTSPPVTNTLSTSPPVTTSTESSGIPPSKTRLQDGENCLEGRIEVYGGPSGDERWGTVCDDYFSDLDADVVCKSLGFGSVVEYGSNMFPAGSLPIVLDDLACYSSSSNLLECHHNGWGVHNCAQEESVGIICEGNGIRDCPDLSEPNVTCDFEIAACGYFIEEDSNWQLTFDGSSTVMYNDPFGSEGDTSRLLSPEHAVAVTSTMSKLEFNYKLIQSSHGNLKVYLIDETANTEDVIWQSRYLRAEEEYKWKSACVELDLTAETYSFAFDGVKGPDNTIVRLDNIVLSEGTCIESLLDEPCTFDTPSTCGVTVECESCHRYNRAYRWWWTHQDGDVYMKTDSTIGSPGDEAWLSFTVPNLNDKNSVLFDLKMFGDDIGSLAVHLFKAEDDLGELWKRDQELVTNEWTPTCINLPENIEADTPYEIKLFATRGNSFKDGIAIDSVELSELLCPHSVVCDEEAPTCGWRVVNEHDPDLHWRDTNSFMSANPNIRLVPEEGGGMYEGRIQIFHEDEWRGICDDYFDNNDKGAMVVCRMLGLQTEGAQVISSVAFTDSKFWLDDVDCIGTEEHINECDHLPWGRHNCVFYEHAAISCAGPGEPQFDEYGLVLADNGAIRGTWSKVISHEFRHPGGEQRFVFKAETLQSGILKVSYNNMDRDEQVHLATVQASGMETSFCVDLPPTLIANVYLEITAYKSSAAEEMMITHVKNMDVQHGSCKGDLVDHACSFESEYMGCAYTVEPSQEDCHHSTYKWRRIFTDNDPVFGEVTSEHYLYINNDYGDMDQSTVTFMTVPAEKSAGVCALLFSYIRTNDGTLEVNVNDIIEQLPPPIVQVAQWKCIDLPTNCGENAVDISVSVKADDATAGIDLFQLVGDPCSAYQLDVSCELDGWLCGYTTDRDWTLTDDDWLKTSSFSNRLISPVFMIPPGGACIEYAVNVEGISNRFMSATVHGNGQDIIASDSVFAFQRIQRRTIDLPVDSEQRAVFIFNPDRETYDTDSVAVLIDFVKFHSQACDNIVPDCRPYEFACASDDECILNSQRCDGSRDCMDGSDEQNCLCTNTAQEFECASGDFCYNYQLFCDGTSDCTDGSDESDCAYNIACNFNQTLCGYTPYEAVWNPGEGGVHFTEQFGLLESKIFNFDTAMCLIIKPNEEYHRELSNIRVLTNMADRYTSLEMVTNRDSPDYSYFNLLPGTFSIIIEVQRGPAGIYLILDSLELETGPCSSDTVTTSTTPATSTTLPTTTTTPPDIPADEPYIYTSSSYSVKPEEDVELICEVYNTNQNLVILSWSFSNGTQIAYREQLFLGSEEGNPKYVLQLEETGEKLIYKLTVMNVVTIDTIPGYLCAADIVPSETLSAATYITLLDDGCEYNPSSVCSSLGFGRTLGEPNFSGTDAQEALDGLYYDDSDPEYCNRALMKLGCDLYTTPCEDGKEISSRVCRSTCEYIVNRCVLNGEFRSYHYTELGYFCKFLPVDGMGCYTFTQECGTEVFLGNINTEDIDLIYDPSEGPCSYKIHSARGYSTEVTFNAFQGLASDCNQEEAIQLIDPTGTLDTQYFCEQPNEPIVYSGQTLEIKISSSTAALSATLRKVLPEGVCEVIDAYEEFHSLERGQVLRDTLLLPASQACSSWIIVSRNNMNIRVDVTSITGGCLTLSNGNGLSSRTCEPRRRTFQDYFQVTMDMGTSFEAKYQILTGYAEEIQHDITGVELVGDTNGEGYVLITRSDGQQGYVCGYMNSEAADLICETMGYSTPSLDEYPESDRSHDPVVYSIVCIDANSLDECSISWPESCLYCSCENRYARAVRCAPKTVSCAFNDSDCGYTLTGDVYLNDGLNLLLDQGATGSATSPVFQYNQPTAVRFKYDMYEDVGSIMRLVMIHDGDQWSEIWRRSEYIKVNGSLNGCANILPGNENTDIQLDFRFERGYTPYKISRVLYDVSVSLEPCQDTFPDSPCSFEDLEVCSPFLNSLCTHLHNQEWSLNNGAMFADSFAVSNMEDYYPLQLDVTSSRGKNIYFKYTSKATLKVCFSSDVIEETEVFIDHETQTSTVTGCIGIPELSATETDSTTARLDFKFNPGRYGGDIALENVLVSDEKCPHYASCDFEIDCGYTIDMPDFNFFWRVFRVGETYLLPASDHTYTGTDEGHYMVLYDNGIEPSETDPGIASFRLPTIEYDGDYRCLSMFYTMIVSEDNFKSPDVEVTVINGDTTTVTTLPDLELYQAGEMSNWYQIEIPLHGQNGDSITVNFTAVKRGTSRYFGIIDDVELLPRDCMSGLHNIWMCDFKQPILCEYEASTDSNSGYHWRRNIGPLVTPENTLDTDADGNAEGAYIMVDSSNGGEGHISSLAFNVDLDASPVTNMYYQFKYYRTWEDSGSLLTHYRDALTETDSDTTELLTTSAGSWQLSPCFQVPYNLQGELIIRAVRGSSSHGDIAVDNVNLISGECSEPTIDCTFNQESCGYSYHPDDWSYSDGGLSTDKVSSLYFPLDARPIDSGPVSRTTVTAYNAADICGLVSFVSDSDSPLLVHVTDRDGMVGVYKFVSSGSTKSGRINIPSTSVNVELRSPEGTTTVYSVSHAEGSCTTPSCSGDRFQCEEQCIPSDKRCDRYDDCYPPIDEEGCGYTFACDFDPINNECSYTTAAQSSQDWEVRTSLDVTQGESTITVTPVNDQHMTVTQFTEPSMMPSVLESAFVSLDTPSCLTFTYAGSAPNLTVQAVYQGDVSSIPWNDSIPASKTLEWRSGRMTLEPGVVQVLFQASMVSSFGINDGAVVPRAVMAIDDINIVGTPCSEQPSLVCPMGYSSVCESPELCLPDSLLCDGHQHCDENEDEMLEQCTTGHAIACDFEESHLCGYEFGPDWQRFSGHVSQIPAYDKTYGNEQGHFMFYSVLDLRDKYDTTANVGSATSPIETFDLDSCVSVWYILNSTGIQPTALTAQIIISVISGDNEEVLWYDYVDRLFLDWVMAQVSVPGNVPVRIKIDIITYTSFNARPGIGALDHITVVPGPCSVTPVCNSNRYQCEDSDVCFPSTYLCNGISECPNGDDEATCSERQEGWFELEGGDGSSYGELRFYYDNKFNAVCFPAEGDTFALEVGQQACEDLGYSGRFEVFEYHFLYKPLRTVEISCTDRICVYENDCSYTNHYAGLRCSNDACFSGEALCPWTDLECIPKSRFCDGFTDCSNNMDELDCLCLVGDDTGRCDIPRYRCDKEDIECVSCGERGRFQCLNHECIDSEQRCDGVPDCSDSSDEYLCIKLLDNRTAEVFDPTIGSMKEICIDSIGKQEADILCRSAGQGYVSNGGVGYDPSRTVDGLVISAVQIGDAVSIANGLYRINEMQCHPVILDCEMPFCGSTVFMEEKFSPMLYTIFGNDALEAQWPWQVHLWFSQDSYGSCGGVYIGDNIVLTAGHCVGRTWGSYTALFGSIQGEFLSAPTESWAQAIDVSRMHTIYEDTNISNDIAILYLEHPPLIDDHTRPVCLGKPEGLQRVRDLGEAAVCVISGFGNGEYYIYAGSEITHLRWKYVHILSQELCQSYHDDLGSTLHDDGICVKSADPYDSACYGDSGGPLICKNDEGYWELYGIVSYGFYDCVGFTPSVFASVPYHLDWIKEHTQVMTLQTRNQ